MKTLEDLQKELLRLGEISFLVRVSPGSSKSSYLGWMTNGVLKFAIIAPPEDGRANKELIKLLASIFQVKSRQIKIEGGLSSKQKKIKIIQ